MMEIGIDYLAVSMPEIDKEMLSVHNAERLEKFLDIVVLAEEVGLDTFGTGEHYFEHALDTVPPILMAAAAVKTKRIRLTSAVTALSVWDPVRVFQQFSTLDLLSKGRIELVVGRGGTSAKIAFPLFGLDMENYDKVFIEKLNLLLTIRDNEKVQWSGQFRSAINNQAIAPRPYQKKLPVWLGVGGAPESVNRAGRLGLPLMLALGSKYREVSRFAKKIDIYRQAWRDAGHDPKQMKVGLHAFGLIANSTEEAVEAYFPVFDRKSSTRKTTWRSPEYDPNKIRQEYNKQVDPTGPLLVGDPETVARKILYLNQELGGIDRIGLQLDPQMKEEALLTTIKLLGTKVKPMVNQQLVPNKVV